MKRYIVVLVVGIGLAAALLALRGRMRAAEVEAPREASDVTELALTITPEQRLTPAVASVPKDHVIKLAVTNRYRFAVSMTLMGYQDRLAVISVPPDSTWRGEFLADRPGEEFGWIIEGAPAGRLRVAGSHLVEGHR
jgi:hypothetical protein